MPQLQRFRPGSISAAELRSLTDGLRRQSPAAAHRHSALLQLAEATAAAVEGPHSGWYMGWDSLAWKDSLDGSVAPPMCAIRLSV